MLAGVKHLGRMEQVLAGQGSTTRVLYGEAGLLTVATRIDPRFDKAVTQPPPEARGDDWQSNFVATASERDWKSEMIWFKSVDKQPN